MIGGENVENERKTGIIVSNDNHVLKIKCGNSFVFSTECNSFEVGLKVNFFETMVKHTSMCGVSLAYDLKKEM